MTLFSPVGSRPVRVGPDDLSVAPYARAHLASLSLPAEASPPTDLTPVTGFVAHAPVSVAGGWKLVAARQGDCPCGCGGLETHLLYARSGEQVSVFVCSATCHSCVATARLRARSPGTVASTVEGLGVVARLGGAPVVLAVGDAPQADLLHLAAAMP
ncbi:MAG: hypothetical protein HYU66_12665 [Armatimonadetes bacterium]|nr:hypothetical protein [Armatimonadota bacterium]